MFHDEELPRLDLQNKRFGTMKPTAFQLRFISNN